VPRLLLTALVAAALAAPLAGCGNSEEAKTPAACLGGADAFTRALAAAPADVRLGSEVAISDCLVEDQPAGELSQVGAGLVEAATELKASSQRVAQADRLAAQLGYLVGAVRRGAAATGGIHTDLVRRVISAAEVGSRAEPTSASYERAYATGYAAGKENG
jgi:hypothetical protein